MNTLRCFLLVIVMISSSTLVLGGDIQGPGKSDPPPPVSSSLTAETQTALQDLTTKMLFEILLTIY